MVVNFLILSISMIFGLVIALAMGILTKKFNWDSENLSTFECGFNSKDQGLLPFSFRFYLLANIFLIFDVELILLFPFLMKMMSSMIWISFWMFWLLMIFFSFGLFYEWNQKMLEWVA